MTFLLWQRDGDVAIAATRRVFGAAEVPLLREANDLCRRLHALHLESDARIETACEEARRRGHAAGFQEGAHEANEEQAACLAALSVAAARHRDTLSEQVAALALQVARKMIGSLAEDERLVALARTAAGEMLPGPAMTMLVHPDRVEAVRERLAAIAADNGGEPAPAFDVRPDPGSAVEDCRIETGLGSVDATLETQLRRLAHAWDIAEGPGANA